VVGAADDARLVEVEGAAAVGAVLVRDRHERVAARRRFDLDRVVEDLGRVVELARRDELVDGPEPALLGEVGQLRLLDRLQLGEDDLLARRDVRARQDPERVRVGRRRRRRDETPSEREERARDEQRAA
jgi:hypothetical protein